MQVAWYGRVEFIARTFPDTLCVRPITRLDLPCPQSERTFRTFRIPDEIELLERRQALTPTTNDMWPRTFVRCGLGCALPEAVTIDRLRRATEHARGSQPLSPGHRPGRMRRHTGSHRSGHARSHIHRPCSSARSGRPSSRRSRFGQPSCGAYPRQICAGPYVPRDHFPSAGSSIKDHTVGAHRTRRAARAATCRHPRW